MPLSESSRIRLLELTTEIVVAAVQSGNVQPASIPTLVTSVFDSMFLAMTSSDLSKKELATVLKPAVPINRSITPDYIICLEDGMHFKSMRGHLRKLGMTPAEYREKWGLASDYPIVAPNYTARRSEMAVRSGLGTGNSKMQRPGYTRKVEDA